MHATTQKFVEYLLVFSTLHCWRILGTRVHIFVLGCHLRFQSKMAASKAWIIERLVQNNTCIAGYYFLTGHFQIQPFNLVSGRLWPVCYPPWWIVPLQKTLIFLFSRDTTICSYPQGLAFLSKYLPVSFFQAHLSMKKQLKMHTLFGWYKK